MLPDHLKWIAAEFEPDGDPRPLFDIARALEQAGNLEGAATVYDRAYGLDPAAEDVAAARRSVLARLSVVEHGITFRYLPAGVFLMGSEQGEPDEKPWHPVWLSPYWLSETPISWAVYCRLMDWEPPPVGRPQEPEPAGAGFDHSRFRLNLGNRIRYRYSDDRTPEEMYRQAPSGSLQQVEESATPYETKPMVSVSWDQAIAFAQRLFVHDDVRYGLPTEAQWEKAARGGLIGARHAWGDEPPDATRCDFNHFGQFSILPMRTFAPNGYGLYAMNGCVWEWTRDWYDRDYYRIAPETDPEGPAQGQEKVLRGGSWADCAEVQTVTYRMGRTVGGEEEQPRLAHLTPNLGFRLCRQVVAAP